jgi:hypothetical protein
MLDQWNIENKDTREHPDILVYRNNGMASPEFGMHSGLKRNQTEG